MAMSFPRVYARPDYDQLIAACQGIDGSELVATFFAVQFDTGKRIWDITQGSQFREVFIRMLHQVQANADGGEA